MVKNQDKEVIFGFLYLRLFFGNFEAAYRQLGDSSFHWLKKISRKVPVGGVPVGGGECQLGEDQLGEVPVRIYKLNFLLNSLDRMFMHENQTIKMFKSSLGQNHGSVKFI